MVPPGGPAALYGFLFQILRTAEWALKIDVHAPEKTTTNVTIIAEPPGGDVDIRFPTRRLVQQFKVRDEGTWSLAEIVEKTLPDLYRAIVDEQEEVQYQFVTNGRMGAWAAAYEFFQGLGSRNPDMLNATDERLVMGDKRYSERSLLDEIVRVLREHKPAKDEDIATTRRKAWHLLARFEFVATGDFADAETSVRRLVATYVPDDAALEDKVARLRDTVFSYATSGNRSFTPDELLKAAGIEGTTFTKLTRARAAVRQVTLADMRHLLDYDRSLSVRSLRQWPGPNRLFVFSGESGQGKSWCLADLAYALMETDRGGLVVFVSATGDLDTDLTTAIQRIVRDVLDHNTAASFAQLVAHVRKTVPDLADPWLTICLDDVASSAEIIALCRARLDDWGIRVALTASPRLARHEALKARGAIIEPVPDFSDNELREFLRRHGRSWTAIPPDVRRTMRRPLLAAIFAREKEQWSPNVEYELYDACWRRLSTVREQPDHPDDVTAMLTLAADFAAGGQYPWSLKKLKQLEIDGAQQMRLESIGWLRADEHGAASIWHDRLLNWAVAENVAQDVREITNDVPAIAAIIERFWKDATTNASGRPRLTYVPMDVVWICAAREMLSTNQLAAVVRTLEPTHFSEAREFYKLLASTGSVIVPVIAQRLRELSDDDQDAHGVEVNAGMAIVLALRTSPRAAPPHIVALLRDPLPRLRDIGIRAARELPTGAYAPVLWSMLLDHDAAAATSPGDSMQGSQRHWKRSRLYGALAASVADAHEWLEKKILALETPDRDAVTLAWLLSTLANAAGRLLWLKVKDKLIASTPPEKPGGLIACIRNYGDAEEIPRLEDWLASPHDFAAPSALGALAIVAPDKALDIVGTGESSLVSHFASWWLPWLMLTRRQETLATTRARLAHDPSVAEWFRGHEHELDAETIDAFVTHLSGRLQTFLGAESVSERYLQDLAHVLRSAAHSIGIDRLRAQAASQFERRLVAAIGRLPWEETRLIPEPSDDLRVLLRRVSEQAAIEALVAALKSEGVTTIEIDSSIAYPVPDVVKALRALLHQQAAAWDRDDIPETAIRIARALALVGDDEGVIEAVWAFGPNIIDDDVAWLTGDREPMDKALVSRLLDALSSTDEAQRVRAVEGLRISRRPEFLARVLEQAAEPGASRSMRYHAIRAARDLVKRGVEVPRLAQDLVRGDCDDVRHVLAELLLASGTPASLDLLAELARKLPFDHVRDEAIVEQLVETSERGREMAELLRSHLWPFPHSPMMRNDSDAWVRLFPVIADDELRQAALDFALIESHSIDSIAVIECVASFDSDAAFDLITAALKSDRKGREVLPRYLLRFGPHHAASTLLAHLPDERVALVRWASCRVLRWSSDESIRARVREMAEDPAAAVREAAYDCAGWRGDVFTAEELRGAALNDDTFAVRIAARDALRRQLRLRQTAELRARLAASGGSDAWVYAEALTTYGDPHLLAKEDDELCIWPTLATAPRTLRNTAHKWLESRAKAIEREAESEDFLRGRSDR
ncbi:MAG TPA: HEAT repeat domain-containing protein [Thermoanaerobaculia bacterium]|nr:HEAT repeat domain-containing protein [Thermoanaerobaculia bacterium]